MACFNGIKKDNRVVTWTTIQCCAVLFVASLINPVKAESISEAQQSPFWQLSAGYWLSQNTYLDGNLDYKIKQYHSIVTIHLQDDQIITEEIKFYPPRHFYGKAIGLTIPDEVGVQLNIISTATLINQDGQAKVVDNNANMHSTTTLITPFNKDSAMLTTTAEGSEIDSYRMLITYPTKDSRMVVNLGIDTPSSKQPKGGLRGASIFNGSRINKNEIAQLQQTLRTDYHVGALVTADAEGHYRSETIIQLTNP